MKILKAYCNDEYANTIYAVMFDEIPALKYQKIGSDYIGTAKDSKGNIIFSEHLAYGPNGAFGGREFTLEMEDGTSEKIKDHWWDNGSYKEHGEFINIGAATLDELQKCFVFSSYNISVKAFEKMLADFLKKNSFESYQEIQEWTNSQYDWYQVRVNGKKLPLYVNKNKQFVNPETMERVYVSNNLWKVKNTPDGFQKSFMLYLFKFSYMENGRLIKVESTLDKVLEESLSRKPAILLKQKNRFDNYLKKWRRTNGG